MLEDFLNEHNSLISFLQTCYASMCVCQLCPPARSRCMCPLQATLQLTDAQQQDMLHLRRCLYRKVGQLSRERDAIMSSMPAASQPTHSQPFQLDFKHTTDKLAETKVWADALCTNRANEARAYVYAKLCLSRGVSLTSDDILLSLPMS